MKWKSINRKEHKEKAKFAKLTQGKLCVLCEYFAISAVKKNIIKYCK